MEYYNEWISPKETKYWMSLFGYFLRLSDFERDTIAFSPKKKSDWKAKIDQQEKQTDQAHQSTFKIYMTTHAEVSHNQIDDKPEEKANLQDNCKETSDRILVKSVQSRPDRMSHSVCPIS